MKRERLDLLADNARYTKRFAHYVGRRCRNETIKDIAKELHLSWDTIKELENQYMQTQLARAGRPGPKRISWMKPYLLDHWVSTTRASS